MSDRKKIIITGANGFIGSALVKHFQKSGWQVVAFVQTVPGKQLSEVVYVKYDLSREPDEGAFSGADVLIHCAYIKNDFETNISGTEKLIALSRKNNLKRNVFLSSFSAHENAVSKYGKQKLAIEKLFDTDKDCSLRAGIVLGDGGLFKQMSGHIKAGKRIPLINGGKQPMQTIHMDDLVMIIDKIIDRNISGTYAVAESAPTPYKDFFSLLSEKLGRKPKFIYVPFFLINFALIIAEAIRFKLPVARENVLGLKFIKFRETKEDLKKLGVKVRNFKESLEKL